MPPEALTSKTEAASRMLHFLFTKIWEEEQVRTDWNKRHLIKISKKGDLSKCEKCRGATL